MSIEQRRQNRARYGSLKAELKWAHEVASLVRQKNDLLQRGLREPGQAFQLQTYFAEFAPARRARRQIARAKARRVRRARHRYIQALKRLGRATRRLTARFIALGVATTSTATAAEELIGAFADEALQKTVRDEFETAGAAGEKEAP
jgi:hypothetical protein